MRILVVEDDDSKRQFLQMVVESVFGASAEITCCDSEPQARQVIEARGPEFTLALLDAYLSEPMPQRPEGLDVADLLKGTNPGCYVILVSGIIEDRAQLGFTQSIDDFVLVRYTMRTTPIAVVVEALQRARDGFVG